MKSSGHTMDLGVFPWGFECECEQQGCYISQVKHLMVPPSGFAAKNASFRAHFA